MENILNNLYIVAGLILALILLYAGATYLWNRKFVPAQLVRGKLVKPLGKIIKEINTYTFKEDTGSLLKKGNPKAQKILSYRNLHLAIIAAGIIAYLLTGTWYWLLALPLSFIIGLSRAMPVIQKRTKILDRIFLIASSSIKFTAGPRAKNAPPPASWNHLTVEKWNKEIPVKMIITFPSGNGPEKNAQKTFQNSFEANVTDENIWNFEWDLHHDRVTIEAAPHLPTQLAYPGSEGAKWSVFPVGESSEGVASYDVATFPHVLVAGPSGTGKRLFLQQHILCMDKGWITIGDLEVGDIVFGVDGKPTKVTHLHPIITPDTTYKVTFGNGESITVDADHLWETEMYNARVSRHNGVNDEVNKMRKSRFSEEVVKVVKAELTQTTNADTISIPELAELLDTYPERNYLYQLAKRVGPAEEIHPTQVFHYGSQIVKQNQMVTRLDFREFTAWYNSRKETAPTKKFPLLRGHFDKLNQLAYELRDSDVLTVDSILEYLDVWQKVSADWIRANIDITLLAPAMVKDLREKAEGKYNTLPAQILVPVEDQNGMISKQDVAALLGLPLEAVQSLWSVAVRKVSTRTKQRELVELRVSEKTISRKAPSYFKYPKKLMLENVLAENVILWDQRDKMSAGFSVRTTQEIFDTLKTSKGLSNHFVRKAPAVEMSESALPINPYVFGAWLGDGYSKSGEICGIDHELFERCVELGYEYTSKSWDKRDERGHLDFRVLKFPRLHEELRANGLCSSNSHRIRRDGEVKHIPAAYFMSSIEQRRELLRGLLDTDGSVSNNTGAVNFHASNEVLAKDVKRLVASLGYIPYFRSKVPTYDYLGEKLEGKLAYTVSFQADPADLLFGLSRKNEAHVKAFRGDRLDYRTHTIVSVERVESVPMRCISVDAPDRLFLVSDSLIPTHNSVLQRNIVFHTIQHNDRWRFLGVDLKRVELTPYNKYKKTVMGIATDVEQGVAVLKYAYNEMMDRYKAMEDMGVNNVMDMADPPYCILLMIDEATMFLGASGSKTDEGKAEDALKGEASDLVGKILRLGRASGVHMLIAMQRPDATVLRGEFKANMDVRMAAGRMDSTPSAMVLDSGEAVNLPGIRGRGLIRVGGSLTTFQGYFAPQDWIDEFILKHPEAEPSTIAPGGHLHDKYMATKRLAAKAAEEAANPTAAADGDGDVPAAASPAPDSSDNSDKPRGLKGLKGLRRKDSSAPEAPVAPPVPAPVAELEVPEPDGFEVDFSDDSLSSSIGDISFEDVPLTENQKALLDSLHRKEDATLDVEVNDIPDFFTGSAKSENSGPKRTIEPELQLNDDDFILDDFEEEDEEEEELPTPPADIMPTPAAPVKPQVKHEWVAASPFGDSSAPAAPKKVQAPVAPTVEEPPAPVVPQRPSLPSRPVRPVPAQPGVVRPQRPASPFNPNSGGGGGVSGNPFLPKK